MLRYLIILFFVPILLFSQWFANKNVQINQNTFSGQVKFVPEDNNAIFETKDSIVKLDLETGEIIKRIDLNITDTNYVQVVADNDLNNVYVLSHWFDQFSGPETDHYIKIENYFSNEVLLEDTVRNIPKSWEHYYQEVNFNLNLLLYDNKLIISYDIDINSYIENTRTQNTKIFELLSKNEAKLALNTSGLMNSYDLINTFGGNAIFGNYHGYMNSKEMVNDRSYSEIYVANLESLFIKKVRDKNYYSSYEGFRISNSGNRYIYKHYGVYISNNNNKLPIPESSSYNFVFSDQLLFYSYPYYGKSYLNITDLSGNTLSKDSSELIRNTDIKFNDGQSFYFLDEDTLKKYTPNYLKPQNLKSVFKFENDTLFFGENVKTINLSSGLPEKTTWLIDGMTVSNELTIDYLIQSDGFHDVSLISENDSMSDTLTKQIYIRKLVDYNTKKIDFDIELSTKIDQHIELKAIGAIDGYELNWNFGDGNIAKGESVEHNYKENEDYTVTLTAIKGNAVIQVIKQNVLDLYQDDVNFDKNIFEKYTTRGGDKIFVRTHGFMKNVDLEIFNQDGISLYKKHHKSLTKGEIVTLDNIGSLDIKIVVTTSEGVRYEY